MLSGGFWTDEDLTELTRLTKKYPNGTLSRWEVIAEHMNRSVQEVTFQAARLKEPTYRPSSDSVAETIVQEATKKAKKATATVAEDKQAAAEATWSQEDQKLLETAIVKYPKTTAGDRWQKIANSVPGRTKEECLARYKYLVQKVKEQHKLKVAATQQQQQQQQQGNDGQDSGDRIENVDNQEEKEETANLIDEYEQPEPVPEPVVEKKTGGKPRNRRKQRKKQMDFSSDEDDLYDNE